MYNGDECGRGHNEFASCGHHVHIHKNGHYLEITKAAAGRDTQLQAMREGWHYACLLTNKNYTQNII